ncbi:MAG: hypothetical protein ACK57O_00760, partial [Planctomyces sp.]
FISMTCNFNTDFRDVEVAGSNPVIPTFLQRKPFDEKVERLFLCGDLEPADSGSNECAVSCNLRLESFFDC